MTIPAEALAAYASSKGVKVAQGDAGDRLSAAADGNDVNPEAEPDLYRKSPNDITNVMLDGKQANAKAATENQIAIKNLRDALGRVSNLDEINYLSRDGDTSSGREPRQNKGIALDDFRRIIGEELLRFNKSLDSPGVDRLASAEVMKDVAETYEKALSNDAYYVGWMAQNVKPDSRNGAPFRVNSDYPKMEEAASGTSGIEAGNIHEQYSTQTHTILSAHNFILALTRDPNDTYAAASDVRVLGVEGIERAPGREDWVTSLIVASNRYDNEPGFTTENWEQMMKRTVAFAHIAADSMIRLKSHDSGLEKSYNNLKSNLGGWANKQSSIYLNAEDENDKL